MKWRKPEAFLSLCLVFAIAAPLFGQASYGTIQGRIIDDATAAPRAAAVMAPGSPSAADAQETTANIRLVGFKAGVATSNTRPADFPELSNGESTTGITFGIFGRLPLGRNIAAQTELVYLRQGVDNGDLHIRKEVLRLPVTLQLLIPAGEWGLRVYGGGTFDFALSCSIDELVLDNPFGPESAVTECPISTGGGAVGLAFGGLIDRALGGSVLTLDLRYDHGLSRLEGGGTFPDLRGFRGFEVTVGVGLPVGARRRA